jgi:DNA-binding NtrC family response regulator
VTHAGADPHRAVVLVVDDDEQVRRLVGRALRELPVDTVTADSAEQALIAATEPRVAVALVDVMLPGMSGLDFLEELRRRRPDVETVVMTGGTSIETAVRAMRAGAYDYLQKPFESVDKLVGVVRHALERGALIRRNSELERLLAREQMNDIIGTSEAMQPVFDLLRAAADTPATVLVTGESGTGKELVARALHRLSRRAPRPFVAVNCSAFSEGLLESELFGHVRGAFTGADATRRGVFEAADQGTLFLDEIGDVTPRTQVSLLRVLQEGEVRRVGANDAIHVDVRVVAATNVDLREAVRRGRMREDLFYRLNVVNIALPPLRERREDIPLLALHFLKKHAARMQRDVGGISDAALAALTAWRWPGNVRELDNCLARAVVLCRGATIEERDLPRELLAGDRAGAVVDAGVEALPYAEAKRRVVHAFERRYLRAQLHEADGNISRAAARAGLDRSNFKRLCRAFAVDIHDDAPDGPDGPDAPDAPEAPPAPPRARGAHRSKP